MIYPRDEGQTYLKIYDFMKSKLGTPYIYVASDFRYFHKAVVNILKSINDQSSLSLELPEFQKNAQFNGEFSNELETIVKIDYFGKIDFFNFFNVSTNIDGIYENELSLNFKKTSKNEPEISVFLDFSNFINTLDIKNLNDGIKYARYQWSKRVTNLLANNKFDCMHLVSYDEGEKIENELFGIDYFIHYSGKVLKREIRNNQDKYLDFDAIFINSDGELLVATDEDYDYIVAWVKEQYRLNPDAPPVNPNTTGKEAYRNKANFISYALKTLRLPSEDGKTLNVYESDIKKAWNEGLPDSDECSWKLAGKRKNIK